MTAVVVCHGLMALSTTTGAEWLVRQTLTTPGVPRGDHFGLSMASDPATNRLMIVSPRDHEINELACTVTFVSWDQDGARIEQKIAVTPASAYGTPGDPLECDIDGDWAALGCYDAPTSQQRGAVFLFRRDPQSGWSHVDTLISPNAESVQFGSAVSLDGDELIVGASATRVAGVDSGVVYSYLRLPDDSWEWTGQIEPPAPVSKEHFGQTLARSGDCLVVGAPSGGGFTQQSSAYVFRRDVILATWEIEAEFHMPAGAWGSLQFGRALSIDGDQLLIGAPSEGIDTITRGAAYLARRIDGVWQLTDRILHPPSENWGDFGRAVLLRSGAAVIGAPYANTSTGGFGAVFRFRVEKDIIVPIDSFEPSPETGYPRFGFSLTSLPDGFAVGAPHDSRTFGSAGAVYRYTTEGDPLTLAEVLVPVQFGGDSEHAKSGLQMASAADILAVNGDGVNDAVHVFRRDVDAWTWSALINDPEPGVPPGRTGRDFIDQIATDGQTIAVSSWDWFGSAPSFGDATCHFFRRDADEWILESSVYLGNASRGYSIDLSIENDTLIVGSPRSSGAGAVHVLRRDAGAWSLIETLRPVVDEPGFGWRVLLRNDRLYVAVRNERIDIFDSTPGGFMKVDEIVSTTTPIGFGQALCASADELFIGDNYYLGRNPGNVHVYDISSGTPQFKQLLQPSAGRIGRAVAVSEKWFISGGGFNDSTTNQFGAVYMFRRDDAGFWTEEMIVTDPDGEIDTQFGQTVAIRDEEPVVAAYKADTNGLESGAIFTLERIPPPGDLNDDCVVDAEDLSILLTEWGATESIADLDGDGVVTGLDLSILLAYWTL